jgi:hypothetical protein
MSSAVNTIGRMDKRSSAHEARAADEGKKHRKEANEAGATRRMRLV